MTQLTDKTLEELQQLITDAQTQLKVAQYDQRKEVFAKIRALAESINVRVKIYENEKAVIKKMSGKVPAKYRHPDDFSKTWTGRGMPPKWMRELIDVGHTKEEYLI